MKLSNILKLTVLIWVGLNLSGCGAPSSDGGAASQGSTDPSSSQSGSTAAMLMYENVLYVLDAPFLSILQTDTENGSQLVSKQSLSGAETLFVYDHYLYVGGQFGVDIYDITDPLNPNRVNYYDHARGCDPIIVSNDIGYITLRNRPGCGGDVNRLEVVDFSDPENPFELVRFPLDFPYGLSKVGEYLAVCQEEFGLSMLQVNLGDAEEGTDASVEEISHFNDIHCFDLIYNDNVLIATAEDGIYQFSVDDQWLSPLSKIDVGE